ncbi:hypothetical protein N806_12020 [Rhodococcus sp. P27]|nr:hypothetical protein N601_18905 [Rhodococcus erythropolis DN1]ERB51818.1 hypothetical protein N806_11555 [Rhodococcus sp. P27]ERB51903.1 hypothetical protein N806_12020 [Rhodococcus sp. P27]
MVSKVSGDGIVDVVRRAVSATSGAAERHDRAVAEAECSGE